MARPSKASVERANNEMKMMYEEGGEQALRDYAEKEAKRLFGEANRLKMKGFGTVEEMTERFFKEFMSEIN